MKKIIRSALLLVVLAPCLAAGSQPDEFTRLVRGMIEQRLTTCGPAEILTCRTEPVRSLKLIPAFYSQRDFRPAWIDSRGLRPIAAELLKAVQETDQEGLKTNDYHLGALNELISAMSGITPADAGQTGLWAECDILLTDALLLLGAHMSYGRVNPETLHKDWIVSDQAVDLIAVLQTAVDVTGIEWGLSRLRPAQSGYRHLRQSRDRLVQAVRGGGWPQVPAGETLRRGQRDERVAIVRKRLIASGDLLNDAADKTFYDEELARAVALFQKRHGLNSDGDLGKQTLSALNVTPEARLRQIDLNLERWRWLPDDLGPRHLIVNTADFSLQAIENGQPALQMKVVVGRPARRTPVFSARMSYMVLNPFWNVPRKIAVEDILPKLSGGVDYLHKQNIRVFSGHGPDSVLVDPEGVDWKKYSRSNFPFRLRQDPGKTNALGQIKFMFPNKFDVYLHDTPQRELFKKVKRDFSSGCIRVEDAVGLAAYLLKDETTWNHDSLMAALETGGQQVIPIKTPVMVHLVYMTAWVDASGALQFRQDIYQRDADLEKALESRLPPSVAFSADSPGKGG